MSELSNYIELLLRDDMPKPAKERIAEMIKDAELHLRPQVGFVTSVTPAGILPPKLQQTASTLALMAKHGDLPPVIPAPEMPPVPVVTEIAQTAATAQALNHRNEVIAATLSGKNLDKTTGRPRKW